MAILTRGGGGGGGAGGAPSGPAGGDLTGTYPNPEIADNAVVGGKIADGAVDEDALDTSAVTTDKIALGAVTSDKISSVGEDSGALLTADGADGVIWAVPGTVLFDAIALIRDEKTANTAGGTFTSGDWRTRDLNTIVSDDAGIIASLAANVFTLEGGRSYWIEAFAPAWDVGRNKLRLSNAVSTLIGTSDYCHPTGETANVASLFGLLDLSAVGNTACTLEHRCEVTSGSNLGLGVPSNFGVVEVYAQVIVKRLQG